MALEINMGYYTYKFHSKVRTWQPLSPNVVSLGAFGSPMVMCTSGDIFQYKLDNIIGDIEGVKIYICHILVLDKDNFHKNIEKLRVVFSRLHNYRLTLNSNIFSLGLKEITYLYYIITLCGIQPYPKKLKLTMDFRIPTTITKAWALMDMVQYCIYTCPRI